MAVRRARPHANEKKLAVPFVFFSTALFISGAAFSHYLAFPMAFAFFAASRPPTSLHAAHRPGVLDVRWRLLAMGVMFQLPMLVMVLARMGFVTAGFLARTSTTRCSSSSSSPPSPHRAAIRSARRSPPPPMLVLYVVSIGVAWIFQEAPGQRTRTTKS